MKHDATRPVSGRAHSLALAITATLAVLSLPAQARPDSVGLLQAQSKLPDVDLPAQAKAGTGIAGDFAPGAMAAARLSIPLPDGRILVASRRHQVADPVRGETWVGEFDQRPGSLVVMTRYRGAITGFMHEGADVYEIAPTRGGRFALYQVDETSFAPLAPAIRPPADLTAESQSVAVAADGITTAAEGVVQDILVLYTAASRNRYVNSGGIESRILSAIAAANQAYANSGLALQLNLVHMAEVSYAESGDMGAALSALRVNGDGVMDDAHALRDQYGADLVALVNEDANYCGIGYVMTSVGSGFASYAFSVTASGCLSNQTLAHEVGHNQGNMHDRDNSSSAGAYPYSYGFRRCVTDGTGFRTVMSYSCSGGTRVSHFSNPNAYYNGYSTGIAYESDPAGSAEAARSMANTAPTIAAFRQGAVSGPPAAPSALSGVALSSSSVRLSWSDDAGNETGMTVERSDDGVAFAAIASLGSNTTSYTDNSLATRTTYWYRVRAFNAAGTSGASNVAVLTTLDEPPAAPGSVAATGSGTAVAVSWVDSSSNESGFEIARESYNSKNRRWSGLTIVATTTAGATGFSDAPGSGTYRYSVRAFNEGGASSWTGPSGSVTVSGASSSGGGKGGGGKGGGKGGKNSK